VTRQRLARVFWLGAAAILVVAALISLVAILGGGFSATDGRILATLGSLLYTGAAALAGLALAEREKARPLGLALLGLSAVTFVLLAAAIWGADGDTAWRLALSGALYLVALTNFVAALPAAPGSIGTFDAAVAFGARRLGATGSMAVSYMLLLRFVLYIPITAVGFLILVTRYGGWSRLRSAVRLGAEAEVSST